MAEYPQPPGERNAAWPMSSGPPRERFPIANSKGIEAWYTVRYCSKLVEGLIAVQAECEKGKTRTDRFNSQPESMNLKRNVKGDCCQHSTRGADQKVSYNFETKWKVPRGNKTGILPHAQQKERNCTNRRTCCPYSKPKQVLTQQSSTIAPSVPIHHAP